MSHAPTLAAIPAAPTPDATLAGHHLMARVAAGDTSAFEELYDEFAPRIFGIVRRVLRDPAQSEEVTQEVLVEAWRTAGRFDAGRGRLESWLLTMAHRRAVDRVRSEQAARDRHHRVGASTHHREHDEVTATVELRLEHGAVREALGLLSEVQREAVLLAYFEGMSYREVAEHLGAPLGTIKTRIRDAMARMRVALSPA